MPSKMAGNTDSSGSPPPDVGGATRLQRNLAEKQRRDKLNGYISELANIVPMVSMASKRLDKTSILRLSAAHLRISQSFLSGSRKRPRNSFKWRPSYFSTEQIREVLESVEGFLLVTTTNGKIMYVSHTVEKFLGHQNIDMIGHSIFTFIHPSDADMVRDQLSSLSLAVSEHNGVCVSSRCSFYCRLREKNQPRSEVLTYQFVHIVGHMTSKNEVEDDEGSGDDDTKSSGSSSSLFSPVLKAFVRVVHSNPYNELSLSDAIENEYVTRHSPDGTIVFADHRLSTITGHLPHEVYGMSAYEYISPEDTKIALFAHKLMFSNNGGMGMIVYRLRTRNAGFVYLKSIGYLQFGKTSAQVDHFVCVNKQLSDEEGARELKRFIERFTPHIQGTCSSSLYESIKSIRGNPTSAPKVETKTPNLDVSLLDAKQLDFDVTLPSVEACTEVECKIPKLSSLRNGTSAATDNAPSCTYSKRAMEKISLETDLSGRVLANYSPLTESSLSTNSPQSEDACMASPSAGGSEPTETSHSPLDTSSELSSGSLPHTTRDQSKKSKLLCPASSASLLSATAGPVGGDSTRRINSSKGVSSAAARVKEETMMAHDTWQEMPELKRSHCQNELSLSNPFHSSHENKNNEDSSAD